MLFNKKSMLFLYRIIMVLNIMLIVGILGKL